MLLRQRSRGVMDTSRTCLLQDRNASLSCNSSWNLLGTQSLFGVGEVSSFNDVVTPSFGRKRAEGEVFFNPMFSKRTKAQAIDGTGSTYRSATSYDCSGVTTYPEYRQFGSQMEVLYAIASGMGFPAGGRVPPCINVITDTEIQDLIVEKQTEVLSKRGRSDNDLWETLAESDEILGTLTGFYKNARRVILEKSPKAFLGGATSAYLATRYGVIPLVKDVGAVLEGWNRKQGKMRKTTRSSSTVSRYSTGDARFVGGTVQVDFLTQNFDEIVVRAMSLDELVTTFENNVGLTSKGLVTLPYELIPYSLVLDWFLNMGDFLGALVPAFGWNQLGSCVTVKRRQNLLIQPTQTTFSPGWVMIEAYSGGYNTLLETSYRTVGLGAPGIRIKSDFKFRNLTRCLDAFSLLTQLVLKKR